MAKKRIRIIKVATGLVLDDSRVLLVKRGESRQPELDAMWELPGGKVEEDENPWDCVAREVLEEAGYEVSVADPVPIPFVTQWKYPSYILQAEIQCYECRLHSRQQRLTLPDPKVLEHRWLSPGQIDFARTLPGTREFIWWAAWRHGLPLPHESQQIGKVLFENVNPTAHTNKYYWLDFRVKAGSEKPYVLTLTWGPYQRSPRTEVRSFEDYFKCKEEILRIARLRIEHKYKVVEFTDIPALREWLECHPDYRAQRRIPRAAALPLFEVSQN